MPMDVKTQISPSPANVPSRSSRALPNNPRGVPILLSLSATTTEEDIYHSLFVIIFSYHSPAVNLQTSACRPTRRTRRRSSWPSEPSSLLYGWKSRRLGHSAPHFTWTESVRLSTRQPPPFLGQQKQQQKQKWMAAHLNISHVCVEDGGHYKVCVCWAGVWATDLPM